MDKQLLRALRRRRSFIAERWERLLRLERVNSALANPDALVYLIPKSIELILGSLAKALPPAGAPARSIRLPGCECGKNPYLAYFVAGEQALMEAIVLIQAELPPSTTKGTDLAELHTAVRRLALSEIDALCGICAHRGKAHACRYPTRRRAGAPASGRALGISSADTTPARSPR
jgi:hypothetical protein